MKQGLTPAVIQSAELDLMAALFVDPFATVQEVRKIVSSSDFTNPKAAAVHDAVIALVDTGADVDPTMILRKCASNGVTLDENYVATVMRRYVTTANVSATATLIREAALQRVAEDVGAQLSFGQISVLDALARLQELSKGRQANLASPASDANTFMDYLGDISSGKTKPFLSTGYKRLDDVLAGGFVSSGLITVAARPGTGKTTVALNFADNVAQTGHKVLYFSLEMDRKQLWARRIGASTRMKYSAIYRGDIRDENDYRRVMEAADYLSKVPFYIIDKPCTVDDIERHIRTEDGTELVVIDHIGLIKPSGRSSRYEIMTEISHRLKQIALSTGIPIIALCQLNRASEARDSKRPSVADLRDSGAIEEDSDVVALLFRPAMHLPEDERPKPWEEQEIEIIVDKNRHGMQGSVSLGFTGSTALVLDREFRR
jgi:replicative DNA helicase